MLESRNRLGGRAGSFTDAATGELVDACQHVSMGCCTNFAHFCKTVGIDHLLAPQPTLYFMTPDRRVSRFSADRLPAPLHLARAFASAHYLTVGEKLRIAWGLWRLMREPADADPPFRDWLLAHRQTERTIDRFWGVVLVSALNETVDRIGLRYARKVFRDGFLSHRRGFEVQVPTVPLGRLYGEELTAWFAAARHRMCGSTKRSTKSSIEAAAGCSRLQLRSGETDDRRCLRLGRAVRSAARHAASRPVDEPYFANLKRLEVSPITSVHLWWDRPIMQSAARRA